jgi:hypothetical protein
MPQTYEAIATTTLGSNQSTITFTSIPQTYTDLVCVCVGYGAGGGGSILVKVNSNTSSIYNTNYVYTDGTTAVTSAKTGDNGNGLYMGRLMTSTTDMGGAYFHIMNYTSTSTFKTMIGQSVASAPITWYSIGNARTTTAVTRLDLTVESGYPFASGFQATIYGIKAA